MQGFDHADDMVDREISSTLLDEHSEILTCSTSEHPENAFTVVLKDRNTQRTLVLAESVARTPCTVLLTGESGVGKELFARYIHARSARAESPFVHVNCTAFSPTVLESQIFGHLADAFPGAMKDTPGALERAHAGTLLIDDICEMPLIVQSKLVRFLQDRSFHRLGGTELQQADVRLIVSSQQDLLKLVDQGTFRRDLFYRLNVFPLRIPALRERLADISPLARYYTTVLSRFMASSVEGISEEALDSLGRYAFPGNIRELVHIIERAIIVAAGERLLQPRHLMLDISAQLDASQPPVPQMHEDLACAEMLDGVALGSEPHVLSFRAGERPLTDIRKEIILRTLDRFGGNRTRTAEALGVSVRTIRNKLRDYNVLDPLDEALET